MASEAKAAALPPIQAAVSLSLKFGGVEIVVMLGARNASLGTKDSAELARIHAEGRLPDIIRAFLTACAQDSLGLRYVAPCVRRGYFGAGAQVACVAGNLTALRWLGRRAPRAWRAAVPWENLRLWFQARLNHRDSCYRFVLGRSRVLRPLYQQKLAPCAAAIEKRLAALVAEALRSFDSETVAAAAGLWPDAAAGVARELVTSLPLLRAWALAAELDGLVCLDVEIAAAVRGAQARPRNAPRALAAGQPVPKRLLPRRLLRSLPSTTPLSTMPVTLASSSIEAPIALAPARAASSRAAPRVWGSDSDDDSPPRREPVLLRN